MDELTRLFEYNRWANLRYLDAADALPAEEAERPLVSSFPGVLSTLVHMLGAEWVWLERWRGSSPTSFPDAGGLTSTSAVRARWDALWEEQRAFFRTIETHESDRRVAYASMAGAPDERPLGELMRHVVNHGSYHRGQLATLLRQLGRTPPATDYVRFLRETDEAPTDALGPDRRSSATRS